MGIMDGAAISAGVLSSAVGFAGDAWPLVALLAGLALAGLVVGMVKGLGR